MHLLQATLLNYAYTNKQNKIKKKTRTKPHLIDNITYESVITYFWNEIKTEKGKK